MFEFDPALFLFWFFVVVYIFGVLSSYAVGASICITLRMSYEPRGLLLNCLAWPYRFIRLLVLGGAR